MPKFRERPRAKNRRGRAGIHGPQSDLGCSPLQSTGCIRTAGTGGSKPSLDLDINIVEQYARGELEPTSPNALTRVAPPSVLKGIAGKDVLCLAAAGGQRSAIFGLLGVHVTVLDLTEGQLDGDRTAASHYR